MLAIVATDWLLLKLKEKKTENKHLKKETDTVGDKYLFKNE